MIYAINAVLFAWIASFWTKSGTLNILISLLFVLMGIVNAALAAPFIYRLVGL